MRDPFEGLPEGGYGCILADPPWNFSTYSDKGLEKSPQAHYTCMTLDDIKALPVQRLAAKDCALIMWAISPMIPHALEVMAAWGFEFKTFGAWAKQSATGEKWAFGTGFILRGAAEHYLVATRGKPKPLSRSIRNLIVSPLRQHSRKPDQMREDAKALFAGPHLELFAREHTPGWDAWGNETGRFDPPASGLRDRLAALDAALDDLRLALVYPSISTQRDINIEAAKLCATQACGGDGIGYAHIDMPGGCEACQMEARFALGLMSDIDFAQWQASL